MQMHAHLVLLHGEQDAAIVAGIGLHRHYVAALRESEVEDLNRPHANS